MSKELAGTSVDYWKEVGRRIEGCRNRAGMQQGELSVAAGQTRQYVGRIENGQATRITVDTMAAIAKALDVDLAYLLLEQPDERRSDAIGAENEFVSLFHLASQRRREDITGILRMFVALDDDSVMNAMLEQEESIHKLFGDGAIGSRLVFAADKFGNGG
jgi:transcriptional regulator with XRE-family HTH domain